MIRLSRGKKNTHTQNKVERSIPRCIAVDRTLLCVASASAFHHLLILKRLRARQVGAWVCFEVLCPGIYCQKLKERLLPLAFTTMNKKKNSPDVAMVIGYNNAEGSKSRNGVGGDQELNITFPPPKRKKKLKHNPGDSPRRKLSRSHRGRQDPRLFYCVIQDRSKKKKPKKYSEKTPLKKKSLKTMLNRRPPTGSRQVLTKAIFPRRTDREFGSFFKKKKVLFFSKNI